MGIPPAAVRPAWIVCENSPHGQRAPGARFLTRQPRRCYLSVALPEKIGKYRVIERIGRGGMGMIYKAHDPLLDRMVALKVISPEVEVTDELRARFFREAQACAKLSHPNIVTVYDMGEDEGRLFIVMELLDGQELRQLI